MHELAAKRIRSNFHILICFNSSSSQFRRHYQKFPTLLNLFAINWILNWSAEAFNATALHFLKDIGDNEPHNNALARICTCIHQAVAAAAERLYRERCQTIHIGPNNFLDLLELYRIHLKRRSDLHEFQLTRLSNGLNRILSTNEMVVVMQDELKTLTPKIEIQSKNIERLLRLANDTKLTDDFRATVLLEEAEAKEKEIIMRAIADDANCDLEVATPSLKMAQEALKAINKNDLNELKAMTSPPPLVMFVLEAVCVLIGIKPVWEMAKKLLSEPSFPNKLMEFEKEQISDATMKKIKTYIDHKDFEPMASHFFIDCKTYYAVLAKKYGY